MRPEYRPPRGSEVGDEAHLRLILEQFGESDASSLIARTAIGTSETRIAHGFGGIPTGWEIVAPDALATVCQTKAADSQYLYLKASAAVNAQIRVF
jgi:hypothetical protein